MGAEHKGSMGEGSVWGGHHYMWPLDCFQHHAERLKKESYGSSCKNREQLVKEVLSANLLALDGLRDIEYIMSLRASASHFSILGEELKTIKYSYPIIRWITLSIVGRAPIIGRTPKGYQIQTVESSGRLRECLKWKKTENYRKDRESKK